MFDKFEKLNDFETQTSQQFSDWDSLQERLNNHESQKKEFHWKNLVVIALLALIPFSTNDLLFWLDLERAYPLEVSEVSRVENRQEAPALVVQKPQFANSRDVFGAMNYYQFQPEKFDNKVTTFGSFPTQVSLQTKRKVGFDIATEPEEKLVDLEDNDNDLRGEEAIAESQNTLISPTEEDEFEKSLDLEIGIQSSLTNGLSNVASNGNSWGSGIHCNLRANYSKRFSVIFGAGINTEFNNNLNYSFTTEVLSFFNRSDRYLNISTKQLYSANLQLASSFHWNKCFITTGGVYYNYTFQSLSDVHESGTGHFQNISQEVSRKAGFTDLLNSNEFGLQISQTFMLNDSFGVTLGMRRGLSNRLSTDYFPGLDNKRTEFSLSISKRIGL